MSLRNCTMSSCYTWKMLIAKMWIIALKQCTKNCCRSCIRAIAKKTSICKSNARRKWKLLATIIMYINSLMRILSDPILARIIFYAATLQPTIKANLQQPKYPISWKIEVWTKSPSPTKEICQPPISHGKNISNISKFGRTLLNIRMHKKIRVNITKQTI